MSQADALRLILLSGIPFLIRHSFLLGMLQDRQHTFTAEAKERIIDCVADVILKPTKPELKVVGGK